jgi:hypothetical protein
MLPTSLVQAEPALHAIQEHIANTVYDSVVASTRTGVRHTAPTSMTGLVVVRTALATAFDSALDTLLARAVRWE